ncbi:MAG: phosphoribosylformylglycinamidine cyclo-ligase, partial [Lawsonibacter sp.]|nr:phosphoribosylformylglycinamidine cyclo-ligase [Lawsonibacter sp.]
MDRHDTIGIDCVAMCVNDIICCGAKPLFFLDYIAIGKNEPEKVASIVSGVAEGCVQAGCALIGGETAEHPGLMAPEDYDLAGFAVGVVDKERMIRPEQVKTGDVILSLSSSGLHSNGFSLVRKVLDIEHAKLDEWSEELDCELGAELLTPTAIYVKPVLEVLQIADVHGISHITGGGFYENIPRCLPKGMCAKIDKASLWIDPIFRMIQRLGDIPEHDMFNTFNMGTGMVLVVDKNDADKARESLLHAALAPKIIGEVVTGDAGVELL